LDAREGDGTDQSVRQKRGTFQVGENGIGGIRRYARERHQTKSQLDGPPNTTSYENGWDHGGQDVKKTEGELLQINCNGGGVIIHASKSERENAKKKGEIRILVLKKEPGAR